LLPGQKYQEKQQINTFFDQLFERIRAVPGVEESEASIRFR